MRKSRTTTQQPAGSSAKTTAQTMEDLLRDQKVTFTPMRRGTHVRATILKVDSNEILADINAKSYGVVAGREFDAVADLAGMLQEGMVVDAEVIIPEMESGETLISLRKTLVNSLWDDLVRAKETHRQIHVYAVKVISGGVLVEYKSLRGFIPQMQLDPSFQSNPDRLVNTSFAVQVLEVDQQQNRLVLSQKEVTQKEQLSSMRAALTNYEEGDTVSGTLHTIDNYSLGVTITKKDNKPEVPGIVHISEVRWERVDNLGELYKVGESVSAKIVRIDMSEGILQLSIKQLLPDPWEGIEKKYPAESQVSGTVVKISNLGAFVELQKGIEGLIHVSKIPAGKEFKEGEKIAVIIDSLDTQNRKMSLSFVPTSKPIGYR
ncbi:S1 RNA-binding domain-containing protein [Candidatus Roizmanbacteria bacterium]|nr:S1 RNA-binding domain-containing protein [Candidatus Roizmanbacteria bacterium]